MEEMFEESVDKTLQLIDDQLLLLNRKQLQPKVSKYPFAPEKTESNRPC
jgi:hypothetical protein